MADGFLVMSGLPASGKTTLGRQLGTILGLAVLDKDDYLESLLAEQHSVDPDLRSVLSREADLLLERDARSVNDGAVIVSFWRRPELSATSGTPTEWLLSIGGLTEVYCDCSPSVAADRLLLVRGTPATATPVAERSTWSNSSKPWPLSDRWDWDEPWSSIRRRLSMSNESLHSSIASEVGTH